MSTLEDQLKREIESHGVDSPVAQILRNQIQAQKSGKSFQSLYLEKEPEVERDDSSASKPTGKKEGRVIWQGWQTSADDAPQPVSILYGRNLRKRGE
jgi:hypothetical protein